MTIYQLAHMLKRTYTNRELIEKYMKADSNTQQKALGIALNGYPFNKCTTHL